MGGGLKSFKDLPSFDELPDKRRYWEWGPAGSYEEGLGKLNLLTDEVVAQAAASEIRSGQRVGLGWEFRKLENPPFGRIPFNLNIKWVDYPMAYDDEYQMNPQQSSQWDGFRHHAQPIDPAMDGKPMKLAEGDDPDEHVVWYGGTKPSEITPENERISIHHWSKKGIVGRGVLIDYAKYARAKGIKYSSFSVHQITLKEIKEIVEMDQIEIRPGDILFIHIGLIEEWESMTTEQRVAYGDGNFQHCGVEQTEDVLRWLWNNHFTAVAGDMISWEVFPSQNPDLALHNYLLAGWGVPIGEIFDLSELAKICQQRNRYSFFVTSAPFNAIGAVSSPPNAIAIF